MTNATKQDWPKTIAVVLFALGLVFGALGLPVFSLFVLMFWHTYRMFPEEGWRAPLFLTDLWFASVGALTTCALVAFSRRSSLHISVAIAVLLIGVIAVAGSYVKSMEQDVSSPNRPMVFEQSTVRTRPETVILRLI